jgi:osmoprotectant transport system permease protein
MRSLWLAVVLTLLALPAGAEPAVRVGSKAFTESRVLCELMAQVIEHQTGLEVERRQGLGGTQIVFAALRKGDIDIYPEYTGTGLAVMLKHEGKVGSALEAFHVVERGFAERWQLSWLAPFGFNNTYALAMSTRAAERYGITRLSDLVAHQAALRAAMTHEFIERGDGFPAITAAYGLELAEVRGMEHGLAYEALASGKVDLVDAYSTDGKLLAYDVRVLEDDRRAFPPYDAAPVARADLLERHPEIRGALAALSFRIDEAKMRRLNHDAEARGGAFAEVARELLIAEGILAGSAPKPPAPPARGFFAYLYQARANIGARVLEHLGLVALALLLAAALGVPLGIALARRERLAAPVLGAAGVVQTIPGLALLALLIPLPGLGLGMRSAVVAIFLYALLPIVRNAFTGIREVDAELVDAARAMGLTERQVLTRVQLPLAARTVMAGVRTSAVISIGVATLAAFIGAGGLGDPIVTGLQLDDAFMILSGAIPAALLAVLADAGLGRLEKRLVPRGLR